MKLLTVYALIAFVIPAIGFAFVAPWMLLVIPAGLVVGPLGAWVIKRLLGGKW